MLTKNQLKSRSNSLMHEYSSLLGDAILRNRTRHAEQSARIEAELASKVKSEFIANMSHELRTPLNTVIGFSKLLCEHEARKLADDAIIEYSSLIRDAAVHLLSVINDILDISKIQSGRYTLDSREVNLDEIIKKVLATFRAAADEAGVQLLYRCPTDLPPVRGEPAKLRQILNNLISNAIKFTLKDGAVVIEALRLADGGVTILIRDTGIGMSEEELAIALTPFGQVDGSHRRWREGTGLGLPIAKSLVELHGGRLEIRTAKGQGTEVSVQLPSRHHVSLADGRDALL